MIDKIIECAKKYKLIAFDMEYKTPQEYWDDNFNIHGCSFAAPHDNEEGCIAGYFTKREDIQKVLDECFNDEIEAVGHYSKIDYICLKESGYTFDDPKIRCTGMALNLLQEERQKLGLKLITPEFLGYELNTFDAASEYGLDSEEFIKYAKEDSIATLRLYQIFKKKLIEEDLFYIYELITPSLISFGDMERFGMSWDVNVGEDLFNKFCLIRDNLKEEIYSMIGGRIDLNSSSQLSQRLFKELGYTAKNLEVSSKTGKTATGVENMTKLARKYPACEAIMAYRTCVKMISTYVEPLTEQAMINDDSRIHPLFWLTSTTGRTRSSNPNVQNCPGNDLAKKIIYNKELKAYFNDLKIKSGFVAPKGKKLIVADYSSVEYRTAAVAAPEPKLIQMYKHWECKCGKQGTDSKVINKCTECGKPVKQGKDLHARNRDIANTAGANIDRTQAKAVSFLTIFGGGGWKLSKSLELPVGVCDAIIDKVLGEFTGLKSWHTRTGNTVRTTGEVRDVFGRRRRLNLQDKLKGKKQDDIRGIEKHCQNMLVNFVAQSPACIIIQIAMQNIRKRLIKEKLWGEIKIICMVHDELVCEAPDALAEYTKQVMEEEMQSCVDIGVPLPVDACIVNSWDQSK